MKRLILFLLLFCIFALQCERPEEVNVKVNTPFLQVDAEEVEFLLKEMSLEEKIGQLIFLDTELSAEVNKDSLYSWSSKQLLSGLVLKNTSPENYVSIIERCKNNSKRNLLCGTWEGTNLTNQFKGIPKFPSRATMASVGQDSISRLAKTIYSNQKIALDIDFIFGPEVNPVLDSAQNYNFNLQTNDLFTRLKLDLKFLKENNRNGILSIADSFRDHIEISNDSLGVKSKVLQKYYNLSMNGLQAMTVDPDLFLKDTLVDRPIDYIKTYLYDEINFDGLIFSKLRSPDQLKDAIFAGTDVFILNKDPHVAKDTLMSLFKSGFLSEPLLNDKVARVMKAKEWIKKQKKQNGFDHQLIEEYVDHPIFKNLVESLYEKSICVLKNNGYLPLKHLDRFKPKVHYYSKNEFSTFSKTFALYNNKKSEKLNDPSALYQSFPDTTELGQSSNIIVLDGINLNVDHAPFYESVNKVSEVSNVLIINFGNPLNFKYFSKKINAIQIFERNSITEHAVAEIIFGALVPTGISQIDINSDFRAKARNSFSKKRIAYVSPEEVYIDSERLSLIDSIMISAIEEKAIPGGQIVVAKGGNIFYSKSFGHHTYDKKNKVETDDLYDLASISKVCGTTLSVMKLYDQRKVALNDKISKHISLIAGSSMRNISLSKLLLHRSNLQPNMPIKDYVYIEDTLLTDCNYLFCSEKRGNDIQIAERFYFDKKYQDSLWLDVLSIKPYKQSKYRYSDVNFNLLQKVIEKKSHMSLDKFCEQSFYDKMGLRRMMYKPLSKFAAHKIAPTEDDKIWRKQLVNGYVHDEYAALQGGVSGSAGVFSNAEELAIIGQMLLNKGQYGGIRYINSKTVELFTSEPVGSQRGLGFDKPRGKYTESCSDMASDQTFGHSGFTGTCLWVDPETELVYVFLSNRIHPSINNKKLFKDKYRGKIHTAIYEALNTYHPSMPGEIKNEVSQIDTKQTGF